MSSEAVRLPRRYPEIVRAAREVFLNEGFTAASVDRIAASASVSKQSVYRAFGDKRGLFVAVLSAMVDEAGDAVVEQIEQMRDTGDVADDLMALARDQLRLVMTPELMRLRRTVIAEAERFPDLAVMFHERGPGRTVAALETLFARRTDDDLMIHDPLIAATRFNWLVMAEPVNHAMLLGLPEAPDTHRIDLWAAQGVEAFLIIYSPRHRQGSAMLGRGGRHLADRRS